MKTYLKGLAMGISDLVPGVSGGTIALLFGIYEHLIKTLKELNVNWIWYYIRFFFTGRTSALHKARKELRRIDWTFLVPLGLGILTAIILGSHILSYLMDEYFASTMLFFIGIVAASCTMMLKRVSKAKPGVMSTGIIIGIIFALIVPTATAQGPVMWLISGFVAICAMLLPGVSGSYLLLLIGQYQFVLDAVKSPFSHIGLLFFFAIGALIGLKVMSKLISYLLKTHHNTTMQVLIGLVLGSLLMPIQQIIPVFTYTSLVFLIIGACLPYVLHWKLSKTL